MPRTVLFVDPPAFCTTVEELAAPALRTRPIVVAPPGADRAVVLALSAEARRAGVSRGMPVRQARKLCPDLILLPPNPALYARASRALHQILRVYAPVIEPRGYGHAFLDLTGTGRLFGPAIDVAERVRREARERLRLPLSVGVAVNKLVSRAATAVVKPEPLLEVPGGTEAGFLAPHSLDVLPDLHPRMRSRLDDYQLELIGEVAAIPETALCAVFGGAGRTLRARARGIDPRPVLPPEQQLEFHLSHMLATDTNDLGVLHQLLRVMSERLGRRLRHRGLAAGRLRIEAGREAAMPEPTGPGALAHNTRAPVHNAEGLVGVGGQHVGPEWSSSCCSGGFAAGGRSRAPAPAGSGRRRRTRRTTRSPEWRRASPISSSW